MGPKFFNYVLEKMQFVSFCTLSTTAVLELLRDSNRQHAILEAAGMQKHWPQILVSTIAAIELRKKAIRPKNKTNQAQRQFCWFCLLKKISAKLGAMMHRMPWSFNAQGLK